MDAAVGQDWHAEKKHGKFGFDDTSGGQRDWPEELLKLERFFQAMKAPPAPEPEGWNPCFVEVPLPLEEALRNISHFFCLRLMASIVEDTMTPEEGTLQIRCYDGYLSFLVLISIYTAKSGSIIVEFQRFHNGGYMVVMKVLDDFRDFLAEKIAKKNDFRWENYEQLVTKDLSPRKENDAVKETTTLESEEKMESREISDEDGITMEPLSDQMDLSFDDDAFFQVDPPEKEEWLCSMPDLTESFSKDEAITSFCEMAFSYKPCELGNLAEVLTPEFLGLCWEAFPVYTVLKLLTHMAQEPGVSNILLTKIDFAKIPVRDAVIAQEIIRTLHALVQCLRDGYEISDSLKKNIFSQVEPFEKNKYFGARSADKWFREIEHLLSH